MRRMLCRVLALLTPLLFSVSHTFPAQAFPSAEKQVDQLVANMSPTEKIGQLVMPATHDNGQGMPDEKTRRLIQEYKAGSVIVYGKRGDKETAIYNNRLQKWAADGIPLWISADLEYGAAQRVPEEATTFPRQMGIGATKDIQAAKTVSSITAKESRAMGFNWNYSPVADVNTNPENPVIGVRSFGSKTDLVSQMTAAQVEGNQKQGVMASAKHFPGHGDTNVDSHLGLATVDYDLKTLKNVHLPPFQAAIEQGVDSIMTAHVIIKAIDDELPATLSKKVLSGLLREDMGFDGIIVTDAMSMDAIDKNWGSGPAAVMAIQAGADIVMATGSYEDQLETFDALTDAYQSGDLSEERVNQSLKRILLNKFKYSLFQDRYADPNRAEKLAGSKSHRKKAAQIGQQSMTLVKNEDVLPLQASSDKTTLIAGPVKADALATSISKVSDDPVITWASATTNPTDDEIQAAVEQAQQADRIIVATYSASQLPPGQKKLVNALAELDKPVVAVSLGLPYDIQEVPAVDGYLATYALDRWQTDNPVAIQSAASVLFGAQPGGRLPVEIEGHYPYGYGLSY